jgi:glucan phosphoethanolaminetransferase (alkaline phosphatase superfamily)
MSLRDDRYFVFDNFAIVAWFFIAVFTWPEWWMFLLPPALLVLDSFRSKYGLVFCILILFTYLFYADSTTGAESYWLLRIPGWDVITMISRIWFGWVFTVLAGLLLFWVFALSKELSDEAAKSSTVT